MQATASLREATVVLDDRAILRGVSLDLARGLTVVRGPNGAGKTTLLRAFAGLVPLARGTRTVEGDSLFIGHRAMLLRGLTARENLLFFARFRGAGTEAVDGALRAWGLGTKMDRPAERLSAGERRRAALARIDAEPVALLMLDEPFADLDEAGVGRLNEAIDRSTREGRIVVVATHAHHELDARVGARVSIDQGALIGT